MGTSINIKFISCSRQAIWFMRLMWVPRAMIHSPVSDP